MILTAVIDRLKAGVPATFAAVEGAEELEALAAGTAPRHGTVFVLPFDGRGRPSNSTSGTHMQQVEMQFLTAVVIRRHDDARGARRVAAADEFMAALEEALAGWSPLPAAPSPINYVAERAAPAGNGILWLVVTWSTNRYIRKHV